MVLLSSYHNVVIYTCPELTDEIFRNLTQDPFFARYIPEPQPHIELFRAITLNQNIDQRFDRAADIKDNFLFDLAYTF